MDVSALAGLGLAVAALVVSLLIEGGNFASLINPSALVLILGGTLGATIMSFPKRQAMSLVGWIVRALRGGEPNLREIIEALVSFAEMARREGLMSLEGKLSTVGNPLVAHGLELVASALDIDQIRSILEGEVEEIQQHLDTGAAMLEAAGGYSPTMGIIGTVMGLIHVLGNISSPEKLAASIATAFLATFYGISFANLFWLPLANKLKQMARVQRSMHEIIIEGLVAVAQGTNPRLVRDRLESLAGLREARETKG